MRPRNWFCTDDVDKCVAVEGMCGASESSGARQSSVTKPGKRTSRRAQEHVDAVGSVRCGACRSAGWDEAYVCGGVIRPGGRSRGDTGRRTEGHRILGENAHRSPGFSILPANRKARAAVGEEAVGLGCRECDWLQLRCDRRQLCCVGLASRSAYKPCEPIRHPPADSRRVDAASVLLKRPSRT